MARPLGRIIARRFRKNIDRPRVHTPPRRKQTGFRVVPQPGMTLPAVVPPKPVVEAAQTRTLQTAELARPGSALRSSIEGFLLDQRSEHTQRAYGKDLSRFVKFLITRKHHRGVETLNRNVIVAYKDWLLAEKLQHTTVDRHLSTLRAFFKWLVEEGVIEHNPALNVRFMRPKRQSPTNGFTDAEVAKLLSRPNLHRKAGAMHYAILMILFYCGLRRSEIIALRTSSINVERGHVILKFIGKGNRERVIPLIVPVWNAIKHYLIIARKDPAQDQYLFSPVRNNRSTLLTKPLDSSTVFHVVRKYAREVGITKKVSPHSCRATAISNARDKNVSDRAIQEFAGWASPDMIIRYDKRRTSIEDSAAHSISYGETRQTPSAAALKSK